MSRATALQNNAVAQCTSGETDGTISCNQISGLRLSGASRTQDLVQAIAIAIGVPADAVGIVFAPI